jgi:hypothetical protein
MLIGVGDDMLLGAIETLVTAQGPGGKVVEDVGKHIF